MPIVHRCGEYGCRETIPMGNRYCKKHWQVHHQKYELTKNKHDNRRQTKYDLLSRNEQSKEFYHSKPWMNTRDYVFARDEGECQACGNLVDDRKVVDHIVALKLNRKLGLDSNNLWTLCYRCHYRKTKLEEKMLNDGKENILKHLDRKWWKKILNEKK